MSEGQRCGISLLGKFKEWVTNWRIFPKHFPTVEAQLGRSTQKELRATNNHSPAIAQLSSAPTCDRVAIECYIWKTGSKVGERQDWGMGKVVVKGHKDKQNILAQRAMGRNKRCDGSREHSKFPTVL